MFTGRNSASFQIKTGKKRGDLHKVMRASIGGVECSQARDPDIRARGSWRVNENDHVGNGATSIREKDEDIGRRSHRRPVEGGYTLETLLRASVAIPAAPYAKSTEADSTASVKYLSAAPAMSPRVKQE